MGLLPTTPIFEDILFRNNNREKAISRVQRHPELVAHYYADVDDLLRFMQERKEELDSQPRVFNHGDFHEHNIFYREGRGTIYVDLETAVVDYPSWELARIIDGLDHHSMSLIKVYVKTLDRLVDLSTFGFSPRDFTRKIFFDYVFKFTGVGIGIQQHPSFIWKTEKYLHRISQHVTAIIKGDGSYAL